MRIQFSLSKKADADLISFFLQQNERTAPLVVAALCSYIKGSRLELPLLPVTITEHDKRMNVCFSFCEHMSRRRDSAERQQTVLMLKEFLSGIPKGMMALYIKGILRYTYGSVIYQTEATVLPQNTAPSYTIPQPAHVSCAAEHPSEVTNTAASEDDIFDLFESLI